MSDYWILDKDHNLIQAKDVIEWGRFFEDFSNRRVAYTTLKDGTLVSTVFLGLDHNFGGGEPLFFETMVFPSKDNMDEQDMDRYSTWNQAEEGHERMVDKWSKGDGQDT